MIVLNTILMGGAAGANGGSPWQTIIMFGSIFAVMYFFMMRPQQKKAKEQKAFLANIQKGDKVVTIAGIHGKVSKLTDTTVDLEIANNVVITCERSTISVEYTRAVQASKA